MAQATRPKPKGYHHGDLRDALLRAAQDALRERPFHEISLRDLARGLGVSEAAPYRHFADKGALEVVLVAEGYRLKLAWLAREAAETDSPSADLRRLVRAYVGFACAHRWLFVLMHGSGLARDPANAELNQLSEAAFDPIRRAVKRRVADVTRDPDALAFAAVAVWVQAHGLAEIVLANFLRFDALGLERLQDLAARFFDDGLEASVRGLLANGDRRMPWNEG